MLRAGRDGAGARTGAARADRRDGDARGPQAEGGPGQRVAGVVGLVDDDLAAGRHVDGSAEDVLERGRERLAR